MEQKIVKHGLKIDLHIHSYVTMVKSPFYNFLEML